VINVDINLIRSIFTVLVFATFIGVCIWAWSSKRKRGFDEAAQLPFVEPDVPPAADKNKDPSHE
jgi:cytochrome c oxidase cbb3-type subunit 4